MTLDYLSIISDETSRIVSGYQRDRSAAVPWSDRWTVGTVARHVAGTHHVVAEVVRGRPDADFGLFSELQTPPKDSPEFVEWFRSGTASLLEQLSSVPADDECWSWYASGRRVDWWARRMAFEAVVHRWDTDAALGQDFSVSPDIAADGIDEFLDVFVAASRAAHDSPAGPTMSFECSDSSDRWWLDLSDRGVRILSRDPRAASVGIRGTAEQLLLMVWGRVPISDAAGVEVSGDIGQLGRWSELIPPM
ncbi:MAG: maleylpyruvate isomerase family mycothiol-dependent enzyme [Acidimicrobiales bacterium]